MGVLDGALDIVSDMLDAARRRRKLKKHKQFQVRVFHCMHAHLPLLCSGFAVDPLSCSLLSFT